MDGPRVAVGLLIRGVKRGDSYTRAAPSGDGGGEPQAGVIRDSAGNLYGTTPYGGTDGFGVVYKLDTTGQKAVRYKLGFAGIGRE